MSSNQLVKEFLSITKLTSVFCGHPFRWDPKKSQLVVQNDKYFRFFRVFLNSWACWACCHKFFWCVYGVKENDESKAEQALDMLYAGGNVICTSIILGFWFFQTQVLELVNAVILHNNRLQGEKFGDEYAKPGTHLRKGLPMMLWITWILQFMSVSHSMMCAFLFVHDPTHRRYTYNAILGRELLQSWIKYGVGVFHGLRMMHFWGAMNFYFEMTSFYVQMTRYWVRELTHYGFETKAGEKPPDKRDPGGTEVPVEAEVTQGYLSIEDSVWAMRSLQFLNNWYNRTFGVANVNVGFIYWGNMIYYFVMSVRGLGVLAMPAYFVMPCMAVFGSLYGMTLIGEMFAVQKLSSGYNTLWANNPDKCIRAYESTFRKLRVEMGGCFTVTRNTGVRFVVTIIEKVVNILVGSRII